MKRLWLSLQVVTHSVKRTVLQIQVSMWVQNQKVHLLKRWVLAGRTVMAKEMAQKLFLAASKVHGLQRQLSGITPTLRRSLSTSGSRQSLQQVQRSGFQLMNQQLKQFLMHTLQVRHMRQLCSQLTWRCVWILPMKRFHVALPKISMPSQMHLRVRGSNSPTATWVQSLAT